MRISPRKSIALSARSLRPGLSPNLRPERWAAVLLASTLFAASLAADLAAGDSAFQKGNYAAAIREWKPLAEKGDPAAQVRIAGLYRQGQGVPRSLEQAANWYLLAGRQGNAEAQRFLGFAYEKGVGVPRSFEEAAKWYRLAADQGDLDAQRYLGYAYRTGQGVPKNFLESARWYLMAEAQKWKK